VAFVETVGIGTLEIGCELNPIAPSSTCGVDSGIQELPTETLPAEVRMDVHGLHLCTTTSLSLEMSKHDELAHPYDLAVQLHDEDITRVRSLNFGEGRPVGGQVGERFLPLFECAVAQELDESIHVP